MRLFSLLLIAVVAPFLGVSEASAMKCTQGGSTWKCAPGICVSGGTCNPKNPVIAFSPTATARLKFCASPAGRRVSDCQLTQTQDAEPMGEPDTARPVSPTESQSTSRPDTRPK
jgi:hypothetical protein